MRQPAVLDALHHTRPQVTHGNVRAVILRLQNSAGSTGTQPGFHWNSAGFSLELSRFFTGNQPVFTGMESVPVTVVLKILSISAHWNSAGFSLELSRFFAGTNTTYLDTRLGLNELI